MAVIKEHRNISIPASALLKRFLLHASLLILFVLTIAFSILLMRRSSLLDDARMRSRIQVDYLSELVDSYFNSIHADLHFLPELNELLRYKSLPNDEDRRDIESEFYEFCMSKGVYDQIRYLDAEGQEVIRINHNDGQCRVIPENELQDKHDRYYFMEALSLKEGEIYISPLDLNKEHGQIELPRKPMIRFSAPVMNRDGVLTGVLILNYKAEDFLRELETLSRSHPGKYGMVNEQGYWLYNDNPDEEWGFMYPDNPDAASLEHRAPELWAGIQRGDAEQFIHENILYTTRKISPMNLSLSIRGRPHWIIVNQVACHEIGASAGQLWLPLLIILLLSLIPVIPVSWFLAQTLEQRKRYKDALAHSAGHDALTNLPNRTLLKARASLVEAEARRYHFAYALLFVDLDGFKSINDNHGHDEGDLVLQETARRLKSSVRGSDTVSRTGGDEFVILLHRIHRKEDVAVVARTILDALAKPIPIGGAEARVGASIGIAVSRGEDPVPLDELMTRADNAMYQVKRSGKNNFAFMDL